MDLLLRDAGAGDEPGALPLLSHALLVTWQRRRRRTLTLAGYYESGGVRGAIAQTAETVFNRLAPDQQVIARHIFLRLTEPGEGTQDTVEVAHEALIREWPRLRGWLDEDREGLRLHRQLTHDAQELRLATASSRDSKVIPASQLFCAVTPVRCGAWPSAPQGVARRWP